MRADYDSQSDTIQIELEAVDRLDRDDSQVAGVIVGIHEERPAMIDLIGIGAGIDERLRNVGERYDLDAQVLIAAARAALAAPDRLITLEVAFSTAA
ncbi:MAG TPA: hypothetical protein VHU86_00090 [Solirubrobacterales bacterium]|jgi:hypothetical protein|nr:hypothetical protein [Solirubrobacterales bacterium]